MKFLDDSGLLYFWQKIKEKLSGKVDKVEGKGLSTNDYTDADKAKVSKIVTNGDGKKFLANDGTYVEPEGAVKDVKVNGTSVVSNYEANIDLSSYAKTSTTDDLDNRIEALENMGSYVGTFDTYALVPNNKSGFSQITVNDYINVRADENHSNLTTRYIATAINKTTGVITWAYDITYTTDISGKMDKVKSATNTNLAVFDNVGQVQDSGKKVSDFVLSANKITNAEIDTIVES